MGSGVDLFQGQPRHYMLHNALRSLSAIHSVEFFMLFHAVSVQKIQKSTLNRLLPCLASLRLCIVVYRNEILVVYVERVEADHTDFGYGVVKAITLQLFQGWASASLAHACGRPCVLAKLLAFRAAIHLDTY